MIIRPAAADDAAAVLEFWRAYAEPSLTDTPEAAATVIGHPTALVLLAEDDGLVGTIIAGWDGWRGNLYHVAVATHRRREGIAARLIAGAEQWLFDQGARRLSALVLDEHDYAVATWTAAGYQRSEGLTRYFKMG